MMTLVNLLGLVVVIGGFGCFLKCFFVVFEGFYQLIHISPYMLYIFGIRVTRRVGW